MSDLVCALAIDPINDYYVITFVRIGHPERWSWEIRRRSKPLGIRITGDGYQSDTAALFAGKQALTDFLVALERRKTQVRPPQLAASFIA